MGRLIFFLENRVCNGRKLETTLIKDEQVQIHKVQSCCYSQEVNDNMMRSMTVQEPSTLLSD